MTKLFNKEEIKTLKKKLQDYAMEKRILDLMASEPKSSKSVPSKATNLSFKFKILKPWTPKGVAHIIHNPKRKEVIVC